MLVMNPQIDKTMLEQYVQVHKEWRSFFLDHGSNAPQNKTKVMFIPANHIPGSIIILFEDYNGTRTLYTGDFRFEFYERSNLDMKNVVDFVHNIGRIDFLYLDVTLSLTHSSDYNSRLPSKREILDELTMFVRNQTMKHGKDKVYVDCSSLGW